MINKHKSIVVNASMHFILLILILPMISVFGYKIPFAYMFFPFLCICYLFILLKKDNPPKIYVITTTIISFILISAILSTVISTISRTGQFIIPTEVLQYIIKFGFFTFGIVFVYNYYHHINVDWFIKLFTCILLIAMIIGILQWIPWFGREFLIRLYPFRDGSLQLSQLDRPLHLIRVHGFAQHATANGGFAAFSFVFGVSVFKFYSKFKLFSIILIITSITNVISSQARAGLLALIFSIIFFVFLDILNSKNRKKTIIIIMISTALAIIAFIILYWLDNEFVVRIVYRWDDLIKSGGGARAQSQPQYFFSMMDFKDYVFGISKQIINLSEIPYGVEIEPINILITYGIIGFVLHYLLVFIIAKYLLMNIAEYHEKEQNNPALIVLLVSSFIGLLTYQVFSVAHFFFREIRIGLFPWILFGFTIGLSEAIKRKSIPYIV